MADEDDDSKTEEPSARKLAKAREEGQVPQSNEIKSLVSLISFFIVIAFFSHKLIRDFSSILSGIFLNLGSVSLDSDGIQSFLAELLIDVSLILAPVFAVFVFLALAGGIGQVGLLYNPKKIAFKLSNLNPKNGIKKIVSVTQLIEMVKATLKIVIVAVVSFYVLMPMFRHPDVYAQQDLRATLESLYLMLLAMVGVVVAAFILIAAGDWLWQRFKHLRQLKMTKQEVKDEHKQQEGDPVIKGRIRQLRMRRARERIAKAVPRASVVITNPTHFAVALLYDMDTMAAPRCVAKGIDFLALKIKEVAREHDVPIVENPPLARALYAAVDLDQEIPSEHYKAVAEVIGYVMRLRRRPMPSQSGKPS